jgi:hypothetical protein
MIRLLYILFTGTLLPAIAAAQVTAFDSPEPLGTAYLVCIALAFVAVLVGFYFYYMRWDEEENKKP